MADAIVQQVTHDDSVVREVMRDKARTLRIGLKEIAGRYTAEQQHERIDAEEAAIAAVLTTVYKSGYDDGRTKLREAFELAWKQISEKYGRG